MKRLPGAFVLLDKPYLATTTKDIKKCIDVMKRKELKNKNTNKKIGILVSNISWMTWNNYRNPRKDKRLSEQVTIEAIPREIIQYYC